jgi:prolyl 4-hydroxylase
LRAEFDWKALALAGRKGLVTNTVERAQQLLDRGDLQGAAAMLEKAQASGDALAAKELAFWCLAGEQVRRDLGASRSFFERAAALGDPESQAIARAFLAGGVGGAPDWQRAMAMLEAAGSSDPEAAAQLRLLRSMNLASDGTPQGEFQSECLSADPDVRLFPSFFSEAECDYLVATAAPQLKPSTVIDPYTGRHIPHPVRTSSAVGFPFISENPAIHALNRRLAAASGTDVRAGEPLQVLRYAPGQEYRPHSDAMPGVPPNQQRVLTFLVYLNEEFEGGETAFPAAGLKVRGRKGDGLLFRNASPDGIPDDRALHAGLPVTSGTKIIASRWIRAAPLILE